MREAESVRIDFYSNVSWKGRMKNIIGLFQEHALLCPDKIGHKDDKKDQTPLTREQDAYLESLWKEARSVAFCKYAPEYYLVLYRHMMRPKNAEPDRLNMGLDIDFFAQKSNTKKFLQFSQSIYTWGDMVYGFVANRKDYKAQTWLTQQVIIGNRLLGAVGDDEVMNALPGIFWANFFSSGYVDWFGREKFDQLPCYRMEELPDGGRLILTSPSPLEYDTTGEAQEAIKSYLGRTAFGDVQNPERPTISPFKDGLIQLADESADWPQRLKDLHKQVFGDSSSGSQ